MGCKWSNVAAQQAPAWERPMCAECVIKDSELAERDATIADLRATVDALTLALSTPVDAPSTASTPGIDKPSTSTAGVYASTSTPSTPASTIDTPSDKDRERKREWARKDRERRRLEAQRTNG